MAQMAAVGKVKTHESSVDRHNSLVDLQVGRAATQRLDIDSPLRGIEVEGLESALLAEQLDLVDVLVSAVISRAGQALRVLVTHSTQKES